MKARVIVPAQASRGAASGIKHSNWQLRTGCGCGGFAQGQGSLLPPAQSRTHACTHADNNCHHPKHLSALLAMIAAAAAPRYGSRRWRR